MYSSKIEFHFLSYMTYDSYRTASSFNIFSGVQILILIVGRYAVVKKCYKIALERSYTF